MSISNILVPNNYNLFSESMTSDNLIISGANAGNFTPIVSNTTNCSITPFPRIRYFRIGNLVYGFFYFVITVPIASTWGFDFTIPINRLSNFSSDFDASSAAIYQRGGAGPPTGEVPNAAGCSPLPGTQLLAAGGFSTNANTVGHFVGSFAYEII